MADNLVCPVRKYALQKPKDYKPPMARWMLEYPAGIESLYFAYIGVQSHGDENKTSKAPAVQAINAWLSSTQKGNTSDAPTHETFRVEKGRDLVSSVVWVCYWTSEAACTRHMSQLDLRAIHASLPADTAPHTGLWTETFSVPVARAETNYAGNDYRPGLASIPDTVQARHDLTAYWGAARDRMPESGYDDFARDAAAPTSIVAQPPRGLGQVVSGRNTFGNLVHIRSGQFWARCPPDELRAYEDVLEPTLMKGMSFHFEHPEETGAMGLRFLRNGDVAGSDEGDVRKETCAAGFFRCLHDLEQWAKRHPSHLAIFNGAIKHAKDFGEGKLFRTWHEIVVLKKGEARVEYVNCVPETGVVAFWPGLDVEAL